MGIEIDGYYEDRFAEGVIDDVEANAIAFSCGEEMQIFVCLDLCGLRPDIADSMRTFAANELNIDKSGIHVSVTHTHTAPLVSGTSKDPLVVQYTEWLKRKFADVISAAVEDLNRRGSVMAPAWLRA